MRQRFSPSWIALTFTLWLGVGSVLAHITPPVVLLSEQDAVRGMTGGATKFFVHEVRLTAEERGTIRQQWGWQAEDELYRFYLGRDAAGQLVAAVIFLTEFTIHGPVRVAVGLNPDGTVKDAKVVELTEETLSWLRCYSIKTLCKTMLGGTAAGILPWVGALPRHTSTACPTSTGRSSPASCSGRRFSLRLRS